MRHYYFFFGRGDVGCMRRNSSLCTHYCTAVCISMCGSRELWTPPPLFDARFINLLFGRRRMLSVALTWQRMMSREFFVATIDAAVAYLFSWTASQVSWAWGGCPALGGQFQAPCDAVARPCCPRAPTVNLASKRKRFYAHDRRRAPCFLPCPSVCPLSTPLRRKKNICACLLPLAWGGERLRPLPSCTVRCGVTRDAVSRFDGEMRHTHTHTHPPPSARP